MPVLQYNNITTLYQKRAVMSTEKAPQNSGSGTDSQASDNGANTRGNPFLPLDQNQTRQFFEAVQILLKKSAKSEE